MKKLVLRGGRDAEDSGRGTGELLEGGGVDDCDEFEKLARWVPERMACGDADMGAWGGELDVEGVDVLA